MIIRAVAKTIAGVKAQAPRSRPRRRCTPRGQPLMRQRFFRDVCSACGVLMAGFGTGGLCAASTTMRWPGRFSQYG